jgi:hypothetical protein
MMKDQKIPIDGTIRVFSIFEMLPGRERSGNHSLPAPHAGEGACFARRRPLRYGFSARVLFIYENGTMPSITTVCGGGMKRVGIRMGVLAQIIDDLNRDAELRAIFGTPVSQNLVVIAEYEDGEIDLRIEEIRDRPLTESENRRFVEILNRTVTTNLSRDQYSRASNWVLPTLP